MAMRFTALMVFGCLGAFAAVPGALAEQGAVETIVVTLDQAKLVKLPTGADTIVIGNPAIADVTVQKNGVMVITGRAPGRTNFIALDPTGTIISESMLSVRGASEGKMLVQRGMERNTYDCAPQCMPSVTLGDEEKFFGLNVGQSGQRDGMARQNGSPVAAPAPTSGPRK